MTFLQDDRCLLASCFHQKVEDHIAREKQKNQGLIQITSAYFTHAKGGADTHAQSVHGRRAADTRQARNLIEVLLLDVRIVLASATTANQLLYREDLNGRMFIVA